MLEKRPTMEDPQEAADTGFSRGLGPSPTLTPGRQEGCSSETRLLQGAWARGGWGSCGQRSAHLPAVRCALCTRDQQGSFTSPSLRCSYPETCQREPPFSGHQKGFKSNMAGDCLADLITDGSSFPMMDQP